MSFMFQRLGCDKNVGSQALEDRCGVCHGNGSSCFEIDTVFTQRKGEGERMMDGMLR